MTPIVYLSSPGSQLHASAVCGMPVLVSYAIFPAWMTDWLPSFGRILIDSGAYSVFKSGKVVDLSAYADWVQPWLDQVDAVAGLDDIGGDWRQSLRNYEVFPLGFPTFHETDPPELLNDLIALANEPQRKNWIGLGLVPPRDGKADWVRRTLDRIPDGLHVHGWALRGYARFRRLDSMDSTNWFQDAMRYRRDLPWLTYAECLEIVVKRYQREDRIVGRQQKKRNEDDYRPLFNGHLAESVVQ